MEALESESASNLNQSQNQNLSQQSKAPQTESALESELDST